MTSVPFLHNLTDTTGIGMSAAAAIAGSPGVSIRDAMLDPQLFGGQFAGDSWSAWHALLSGFYGLPLSDAEASQWEAITGRSKAPQTAHDELWLAVGRRGGKSQCAALLAVYEAAFFDYRPRLAPGEVATVMILAADRKQARTVMRYVSGLLHSNPMLSRMIVREDREAIELSNRTVVEVHTASFRSVRGYSLVCAICDEVAYWRSDESANPDREILAAIRPALATLDGKLIALSSPYAKRGELWQTYFRHYGVDSPILVAQAASRSMNPLLSQRIVDEAQARDPDAARSEWLGQFRDDIQAFVARSVVDEATRPSPLQVPFQHRFAPYIAFADPSGGGADEFTLAIGHMEGGLIAVDALHARRGSPQSIAAEFAALLGEYGIGGVTGDRYAGQWVEDAFRQHRIAYTPAARPKSELYLDTLAALNSGRVELPPDEMLLNQFLSLERRTARSGRDSIDHAPGGHDDRANAVAGLIATTSDPIRKRAGTW